MRDEFLKEFGRVLMINEVVEVLELMLEEVVLV